MAGQSLSYNAVQLWQSVARRLGQAEYQINVLSSAVSSSSSTVSSAWYIATAFSGVDKTGAADSASGIQTAINSICSAGGGTLFFPAGHYKIASQLTIPVTTTATSNAHSQAANPSYSGTIYLSSPLRITGDGGGSTPRGDVPDNGTILDFTSGSGIFHVTALGEGLLEVDHVQLRDSSAGSNTFFFTTNTVLTLHDFLAVGNIPSYKAMGTYSITDLVKWGGTGPYIISGPDGTGFYPYPTATTTGCFQGQGSSVRNAGHINMRHCGVFDTAANAITYDNIAMYNSCGSATYGDAPLLLKPSSFQNLGGNNFSNFDIEMSDGYMYGAACFNCRGMVFDAISCWDSTSLGGSGVAGIYFDSASYQNTVTFGYLDPGLLAAQDLSGGRNSVLNATTTMLYEGDNTYDLGPNQTQTSRSYVVGSFPQCVVTTGHAAKVTLSAALYNSLAAGLTIMAVNVSGATSIAPSDAQSLSFASATANLSAGLSRTVTITGLNPGVNVFTFATRVDGTVGGTGNYINPSILVEPLP